MLVLSLSFLIAVLDQVAKYFAQSVFSSELPEIRVISGFFSLRYVQNTGAAWGMLEGRNVWLVAFSLVALILFIRFRRHIFDGGATHRVCAGLMVGGVVGNLVDRVRLGYVVDYLDFYWRDHHFPAFNVADASICVGVGLYLLSHYLSERQARRSAAPAEAASPAGHADGNSSVRPS